MLENIGATYRNRTDTLTVARFSSTVWRRSGEYNRALNWRDLVGSCRSEMAEEPYYIGPFGPIPQHFGK